MTTFSASDAKELTEERIEELKAKQIDDVFTAIKNTIDKGEYEVLFYDLYEETENLLKELGYNVFYYNGGTTVSWDEAGE